MFYAFYGVSYWHAHWPKFLIFAFGHQMKSIHPWMLFLIVIFLKLSFLHTFDSAFGQLQQQLLVQHFALFAKICFNCFTTVISKTHWFNWMLSSLEISWASALKYNYLLIYWYLIEFNRSWRVKGVCFGVDIAVLSLEIGNLLEAAVSLCEWLLSLGKLKFRVFISFYLILLDKHI